MLKPRSVLEEMHPDDTNVYALCPLDKYENRPDILEQPDVWQTLFLIMKVRK